MWYICALPKPNKYLHSYLHVAIGYYYPKRRLDQTLKVLQHYSLISASVLLQGKVSKTTHGVATVCTSSPKTIPVLFYGCWPVCII